MITQFIKNKLPFNKIPKIFIISLCWLIILASINTLFRDFVDINLLARDARALRKYIREIAPDTDLVFNFEGDGGYTEENVEIPIGANFFWPDAAI